ncbi:divalent metal cation transporter [Blastopirellula sp. JC732]|uniref:Divalent metal cation transporter n=1 Tax=Blastopirellula sediminis TaxID=2894196 RepID=A0A9X1SG49_9BACT|nr:divalent metal cation transporter [Blastopirellula sediminis]MCC9608666.1 divalent metal cation transporter [Blastopirellula sediminis]MCC9628557.1 divalent metal cation transporter [Blastopirellula sediminis]
MSEATIEKQSGISLLRVVKAIGPAIVVASVVLGPGSILSNSKVGAAYGYDMIWVLGLASVFMALTVFLAAVLGISYAETPFTEIANRLGRPVSIVIGVVFFLITSCFQFTNNLAIIDVVNIATESAGGGMLAKYGSLVAIVLVNLGLIWALYGSSAPYRFIEKLMMVMVGLMLLGFMVNLIFVQPSLPGVLGGMVPKLPEGGTSPENIVMLLGMFGTTFSIAGAFYQIYAVREKNWTRDDLANGIVDSIAGIAVLGGISFVIMITSATVLHGANLTNITDVAKQLEPLIGPQAKVMFCIGLSAGAFSSLLVNALIGGTALSDSLGLPASVKDGPVKAMTVAGLMIGMLVAIAINWLEMSNVQLIVFAQALTVIGVPLLAFAMLFLSLKLEPSKLKAAAIAIASASLLLALLLSGRMLMSLIQKLMAS